MRILDIKSLRYFEAVTHLQKWQLFMCLHLLSFHCVIVLWHKKLPAQGYDSVRVKVGSEEGSAVVLGASWVLCRGSNGH